MKTVFYENCFKMEYTCLKNGEIEQVVALLLITNTNKEKTTKKDSISYTKIDELYAYTLLIFEHRKQKLKIVEKKTKTLISYCNRI